MAAVRPCTACRDPRPDNACGPHDEACTYIWSVCHAMGDHRRCQRFSWPCEAADQHPDIRQAAHEALSRTGRTLAVLCTACEETPRVLATFGDDLWSAKGLRNSHAKRHGLGRQEKKGTIYVVDAEGQFH